MLNGYQVANVVKAYVKADAKLVAAKLRHSDSLVGKFLNAMTKKGWLKRRGRLSRNGEESSIYYSVNEEGLPKNLSTLKRFHNKQVDKVLGYETGKEKPKPTEKTGLDRLIEKQEKSVTQLRKMTETAENKLRMLKEIRKEL